MSKIDEYSSLISPYNFGNGCTYFDDLSNINSINSNNEDELIITNTSTLSFLNNLNILQNNVNNPIDGIYSFEKIKQILLNCNNSNLNDILGKMKTEKIN